ncbi:hypothetical protein C8J57DRAFT_1238533 [Mycena rebaudengoi]|nr:hypothetical protein C8J57DRAFT_1238533 [Mycena rebaudengoi]
MGGRALTVVADLFACPRVVSVGDIGVERQWWTNAQWRRAASTASDEDGGRKQERHSELENAANLAAIKFPDQDCDLFILGSVLWASWWLYAVEKAGWLYTFESRAYSHQLAHRTEPKINKAHKQQQGAGKAHKQQQGAGRAHKLQQGAGKVSGWL